MNTRFFRLFSLTGAAMLALALTPLQANAVNVSIGLGGEVLPGVYGSVNIDNGRYPALVYGEPLLVSRSSRILDPVYLHVPPGHLRRWGRHCGEYGACGRPVYFVRSRDYYDFSPRYIEQRYVYRDRITYINRGGHDRRDFQERRDYDRRDYGRDDYNRRDYRRDDRHDDRRRGKGDYGRHDHDHGGHGGHGGRGRYD